MKANWLISGSSSTRGVTHARICYCSYKQDLKGQTVAVIGLGISGRAAARLALTRGASVVALDRNENLVPLEEQDFAFEKHGSLKTILGNFDQEILENADRVVVSPGVPIENYGLSVLLQSRREVMSELDFAAEVLPKSVKVLAVTGTNGKSTVTTFAGQMLSHLGIKAFVGGNLGNPLSEAAVRCLTSSSLTPSFEVAVVEVSSYQMQIQNKYFCPSVAVVLNLTPDHLERHKTMQNYAMSKCRIFSHMINNKVALLPTGNQYLDEAFKDYEDKCNVARIGGVPGVKVIFEDGHGRKGCLFENSHCWSCYHARVEYYEVCRDARVVTWVDDSKATNVEATYTGLMGLREQKSVILIGGLAKIVNIEGSAGFELLVEPLKYHRCVITFGFSGMMIHRVLCAAGLSIPCIAATNLADAVNCARSIAKSGDAIVLSPGCASFDEFRNFEDRGKFFQELAFASL